MCPQKGSAEEVWIIFFRGVRSYEAVQTSKSAANKMVLLLSDLLVPLLSLSLSPLLLQSVFMCLMCWCLHTAEGEVTY